MKKILGISLIFVSCIGLLIIKFYPYFENINHSKKIDNIFLNGNSNYTKYVGYIFIEKINLKRGIINEINDKILNDFDVGMYKNDNIILAGHDVPNVFGNLKKLDINDKIDIYLDKIIKYHVIKKVIVNDSDLTYLDNDLVLITCTNDGKRLLILAKKDT